MSNKRLEIIEKLRVAEENLINLKKVLADCDNYYFKTVHMSVLVDTQSFDKKYKGEDIQLSPVYFKEYLDVEIKSHEIMIKELIEELTKGLK